MKISNKLEILLLSNNMDAFYYAKQSGFRKELQESSDKYQVKEDYLSSIHSGHLDIKGMARGLAEDLSVEEFQDLNEYIQLRYEEAKFAIESEYRLSCLLY